MNYKKLNYLTVFIYLISSTISYSIEPSDIKNLIIHNEKKKIEKIEFFDSKNKKISLDDFNSKILIVNFWATWCAPCKEEMPHLDQLKSNYNSKDIEIIPINIGGENLKKSKFFFEELNIKNLEIFSGSSIELTKKFKLRGIPTTIFIDKNNYEFARVIGFIDFKNKFFQEWLNNYL